MKIRKALLALALAGASAAGAQEWPAKPIRWIVPFAPGGATDLTARVVGQKLSERLKRPVLIENRPGAASNIGMELAAKSTPDGYTIVLVIPNVVTGPLFYKLNYEPMKDLAPVALLTRAYSVLLVNPSLPAKTLADILALAKAKPGTLTCGSGGGMSQISCGFLRVLGKVDITYVPYKGMGPAMTDLVGGQITMTFDVTSSALPHIKASRARPIAITHARRIPSGPFASLPAMSETLPGFEVVSWQGVMAPAGTPRPVIQTLNKEIGATLDEPAVREKLIGAGLEIDHGSPEAFGELLQADYAKYARIIQETGLKGE